MIKRIFTAVALTVFLIAGCAKTPPPVIVVPPPAGEIDTETIQRVENILERVKNLADSVSLDRLGSSTMNESVILMDIGEGAVPLLIRDLKTSDNYRYRYWLVDLMGYMNTPHGIIPLVEVIEDEGEEEKVRMRACESIKELRYPKAIDYLLISRDLVRNDSVRENIDKAIGYLR